MAASALAASDTSHLIAMAPIAFACAFAASMLTSSSATLAPALASSAAVAAPRPEPPPVTIAACPLMSMVFLPKLLVFRSGIPDRQPVRDRDDARGRRVGIKLFHQRGAMLQHHALVERAFVGRFAGVARGRRVGKHGTGDPVGRAGRGFGETVEQEAEFAPHALVRDDIASACVTGQVRRETAAGV